METELISDLQNFHRLQAEWNQLAERFRSPLLRHEWFAACLESLHSKHATPWVITVRSDGRLCAVAPLIFIRRTVMRRLEIQGAYDIREPSGFIYENDEAAKELIDTIMNAQKPFHLSRIGKESKEMLILHELPAKRHVRVIRDGVSTLRVPLQKTWDEFEASMSSGRRSDLRRYRRRAEKIGKFEFEAIRPNIDNLPSYMEELFRIEASGWKGRKGSAILSLPHSRKFYEQYARSAVKQDILRFFFLKIDGKVIAARLAVEYSGRLWDLKIGYDEALSKCVPGVLLTHETLRYAVSHGLEAYEFLGCAEAWERYWPCEEDHHISFRAYPISINGQLSLMQDGFRSIADQVFTAGKTALQRATGQSAEHYSPTKAYAGGSRSPSNIPAS